MIPEKGRKKLEPGQELASFLSINTVPEELPQEHLKESTNIGSIMREVLDATSHWNDLSSMIQEKHEPIKEMTIQEEALEELSNVGSIMRDVLQATSQWDKSILEDENKLDDTERSRN